MHATNLSALPADWNDRLNADCEALKTELPTKIKYDNSIDLRPEQRILAILDQAYGCNPCHIWERTDLQKTWNGLDYLKRLSVEPGFCSDPVGHLEYIKSVAKRMGLIVVREPIQAERPKLIIGCGSRTEADNADQWMQHHAHRDADTIDLCLGQSPTWVGCFAGSPSKGNCCHPNSHAIVEIVGKHHYQTIYDEGPVDTYDHEFWKQIDTLLKPGGFFIGHFYPWMEYEPIPNCHSTLKLQPWFVPMPYNGWDAKYWEFPKDKRPPFWTAMTNNMCGQFIVTKADMDGNHPNSLSEIKLEDFPDSCRPKKESGYYFCHSDVKARADSIWSFPE